MTSEYAQRLHRGWSKEFLIEVFGLTEAEYFEIFGKHKEDEDII
jgi:hypothetical protein